MINRSVNQIKSHQQHADWIYVLDLWQRQTASRNFFLRSVSDSGLKIFKFLGLNYTIGIVQINCSISHITKWQSDCFHTCCDARCLYCGELTLDSRIINLSNFYRPTKSFIFYLSFQNFSSFPCRPIRMRFG